MKTELGDVEPLERGWLCKETRDGTAVWVPGVGRELESERISTVTFVEPVLLCRERESYLWHGPIW